MPQRSDRPAIVCPRAVYEADFPSEPASSAVFDLTNPALSFSRSRKLSPLMLMVLEGAKGRDKKCRESLFHTKATLQQGLNCSLQWIFFPTETVRFTVAIDSRSLRRDIRILRMRIDDILNFRLAAASWGDLRKYVNRLPVVTKASAACSAFPQSLQSRRSLSSPPSGLSSRDF